MIILYYVAIEDLFSVIKRAHIDTGHGGHDRMLKHTATKYATILPPPSPPSSESCSATSPPGHLSICPVPVYSSPPSSPPPSTPIIPSSSPPVDLDLIESRHNDIQNQRQNAREAQLEQAEHMVKRNRMDLSPGEIKGNVAIHIPTDLRNVVQIDVSVLS